MRRVCAASVASVAGVESVAGVVFSDDRTYVMPTVSAPPSLNATCDVGSPIAKIETDGDSDVTHHLPQEMSLRDVVFSCPAIDNHTHPLLKEECCRNLPFEGVISGAQPDARDYPEQLDKHRSQLQDHGRCQLERRQREMEFVDEPHALVVGSGHGGIRTAARLKHLGVPTLVVERNATIGDNWRNRYYMLCLHDPVRRFWNSGDPPPRFYRPCALRIELAWVTTQHGLLDHTIFLTGVTSSSCFRTERWPCRLMTGNTNPKSA